jgi:predicted Zn finger-like uncharacterized protein
VWDDQSHYTAMGELTYLPRKDSAAAYSGYLAIAFLSPGTILVFIPHQSTSLEGPMKAVSSTPSPSPAHVEPATCPACHSSSIVTKAKSPDADSYWRCTNCGEVWNVSRWQVTRQQGSYRWR